MNKLIYIAHNILLVSTLSYIGLAGGNELENAEIFGLIDATEDLWMKLIIYFYETDETKKVTTN